MATIFHHYFLASIPLQIVIAVSTHSQDADLCDLGGVITAARFLALIQSDQVAQGANAFHLANPVLAGFPTENYVLPSTSSTTRRQKFFFQSLHQWATVFESISRRS